MAEKTFVQFGAGNIGRSFLGQLFSRAGYRVIFIDINAEVIEALNQHGAYRIIIKEAQEETIAISNVAGIMGTDTAAVAAAIADCELMGTSVGKGALPHIMVPIAAGLQARDPARPLDIIIAENIHDGADLFREQLTELLPDGFDLEERVGLVETSIGKMVPIMTAADRAEDPLWVFAEEYNSLILDAKGFRNPVPEVSGLAPKAMIKAWVDRKLFIHNLGHAACAYLGELKNPGRTYMYEVLAEREVMDQGRAAMRQSRDALLAQYPEEFTSVDLDEHIKDLLRRFTNRHLGDTVFRVGRDLPRKLGREDRLIGGMRLCAAHGRPYDHIARAAAAAFFFKARDENGEPDPRDAAFHARLDAEGFGPAAEAVTGLDPDVPNEASILDSIEESYAAFKKKGM